MTCPAPIITWTMVTPVSGTSNAASPVSSTVTPTVTGRFGFRMTVEVTFVASLELLRNLGARHPFHHEHEGLPLCLGPSRQLGVDPLSLLLGEVAGFGIGLQRRLQGPVEVAILMH